MGPRRRGDLWVALVVAIVAVTVQSAFGGPCTPPPAGLVHWWPGDGNADDIQGGSDGTLQNGATFGAGKVGQAFHFNGSSQFVEVTDPTGVAFERTSAFSIDAWIRTTETARNMAIVAMQSNSGAIQGYAVGIDNGETPACYPANPTPPGSGAIRLNLQATDDASCPPAFQLSVRGTTAINDGLWHHVAVTYDGSGTAAGVKLYVNGVAETLIVHSDTLGTRSILTSAPFTIGSRQNGGLAFVGDVDEVEVFNRVLSVAEIQTIVVADSAGKCRACAPPPLGLRAWWPGESNADDIQNDSDGTLQNGVTFVAGKVGVAFHFNGSNQFVQVTNTASLNFERTDAFTLDAWVRTTETTRNILIAAKQGDTAPVRGYGLFIDNGESPACDAANPLPPGAGRIAAFLNGGSTSCPSAFQIAVAGSRSINDGQWHHVAMTYDGSSSATGVKLYVDGVEETLIVHQNNLGTQSILNGAPFTIGSRQNGGGAFNGDIDEVEVFGRALAVSEIQAIADAGSAGKCSPCGTPAPVHRFFSTVFDAHFYTTTLCEMFTDCLVHPPGSPQNVYADNVWHYEGVGFFAHTAACSADSVPIHRFFSATLGSHFFTANLCEMFTDCLVHPPGSPQNVYADNVWHYEGIAFYGHSSPVPGAVRVYRFFSPLTLHHFYTADQGEAIELIIGRTLERYRLEGVGWYAPSP